MEIETRKVDARDVTPEIQSIMDKSIQVEDMLIDFFDINQINPQVAMSALINMIPRVGKVMGIPFESLRLMVRQSLSVYEEKYDEL